MTYLFGAQGASALQDLLRARALLAFDYDGTLSPLRRGTVETWLRPTTRKLFAALCARHPCAVISGRGLEDLRVRMAGAGPCILVGNHGMELERTSPRAADWSSRVGRWVRWLAPRLARMQGVTLEVKRFSVSVHWRGAPKVAEITRRVHQLATHLEGARLIGGKQVLNIVPAGAPNKGDALRQLMRRLRCPAALYVGDDVTDEDAFALGRSARVLGVRVGRRLRTHATFYLRSQGQMDTLLRRLLPGLRKPGRGDGDLPTRHRPRHERARAGPA